MEAVVSKKRIEGLDIVRTVAVILVLTIHFFLNTSYYVVPREGISLKMQSVIRNFCMSCVPLFLILTGFLNNKKRYDKKFIKGLFDILIIWFFYSTIEFIALKFINGNSSSFLNYIYNLTSFKYSYSWYIKMYIGLYFIAPVINNAYYSFDSKNRKIFVAGAISIIILPNFINAIFKGIIAIPDYWVNIFPIAYYIFGKFLADMKTKIKKKNIILFMMLNTFLIYIYQSIGSVEYQDFLVFTQSVLIFLFLYDIRLKNNVLKKLITYISNISLDIYLSSCLIDKLVYKFYYNQFHLANIGQNRIIFYAPIILLTVFIICVIYASIRKKIINVR